MKRLLGMLFLGGLAAASAACGSDDTDGAGGASGSGGSTSGPVTCASKAPPGAAMPAPVKAYSGGQCPSLQVGTNTITSSGAQRQFILALPSGYDPSEQVPAAFLWHWLGGSASDFLSIGSLQAVADKLRFIAVIPEKKGDVQFSWPATALESDGRLEEELTFFDDMLACVAKQYNLNLNCVSSVGVSAGALWTDLLAWERSNYLASFISLSGGTGGGARAWGGAEHKLPALVVWGGETDNFILNFQNLSLDLEQHLTADGHFIVECVHNCGHGVPPLEGPPGSNPIESFVEGVVRFAIEHPFWLTPGDSPWIEHGLPAGLPPFCAIGAGMATPRTGDCTGKVGI